MVTSRAGLRPRTMSASVVLPQLGSVLISVAHVTTKGHMNAWGSKLQPEAMLVPRVVLLLESCQSEWPALPSGIMVSSGPGLLSKAMSGFGLAVTGV